MLHEKDIIENILERMTQAKKILYCNTYGGICLHIHICNQKRSTGKQSHTEAHLNRESKINLVYLYIKNKLKYDYKV